MGGEGGVAGAQPVGRMESGGAVQPHERPRHQPEQEEEEEEEEEPGSLERVERSRKTKQRTNKKNPNEKPDGYSGAVWKYGQMRREAGQRGGRGQRPVGAVQAEVMAGTRCPGRTLLRTGSGGRSLSGAPGSG